MVLTIEIQPLLWFHLLGLTSSKEMVLYLMTSDHKLESRLLGKISIALRQKAKRN